MSIGIYNITNTTANTTQYATFNTGCYNEIQTVLSWCKEFQIDVLNRMSTQFHTTIWILAIMIFYYFYIKRYQPKFSQTEFYQNYIAYRIDFIIMLLTLIMIAFLFI